MNNLAVINGVNVEFEVAYNAVYTTSLIIADIFEKRHDNIIAQIKALPQDEFNALNFKVVEYKDKKGELRPCYNLTRDGFSLLVMGFTGEKAYKWKVEFIKAFNEMEKCLKSGGFNDLSLIDELKNSNLVKDEYKKEVESLKDELLQTQRELINFYNNKKENAKQTNRIPLKKEEVEEIYRLYDKGLSFGDIAAMIGRSKSSIRNYCLARR
ncbi:Rha family transcriptional regulator [Helicobacter pullorum]|uniref:Rha family transcriptional regulator n=1 Tax=Helicobacter pullorum TaxID=35818 RepID=UPI0013150C80|nr:Rha family transcriptional regulator [Helicobacter pullorum]